MTTAVLICPGRGTSNKPELGALARRFPDAGMLADFDARRADLGQETLSALDGADRFSVANHTRGDHASVLIYASSLGDRMSVRDDIEIVAVTGASVGWWSALACGGAVSPMDGFEIVNTMGALMQDAPIGGRLIHPHVDHEWRPDPARKADLLRVASEIDAHPGRTLRLSIDLGGMLVLAGDAAGLAAFEAAVPALDGFPMRLTNQAAFHTSLMAPISAAGRARLGPEMVSQPSTPLIDGRGAIWWPGATDLQALWDYTLGHQVTEPFDFTRAIWIAAREFAPDLFIVTGPGGTLGDAVAQSLIAAEWRGMDSKSAFQSLQAKAPLVISMGRDDQRDVVA